MFFQLTPIRSIVQDDEDEEDEDDGDDEADDEDAEDQVCLCYIHFAST